VTPEQITDLAAEIHERTRVTSRRQLTDPQSIAAIVAVCVVLVSAVSAWAATTTRLDSTAEMVTEVRDDLRELRRDVASEGDLLRLEERVQHLERQP